jgi:hypothetical protein
MNDLAKTIPKIYVALEDRQADHQASVVEFDKIAKIAKITKKDISILIDSGSNYRSITPKIVDSCILHKIKHKKYWLVHLVA